MNLSETLICKHLEVTSGFSSVISSLVGPVFKDTPGLQHLFYCSVLFHAALGSSPFPVLSQTGTLSTPVIRLSPGEGYIYSSYQCSWKTCILVYKSHYHTCAETQTHHCGYIFLGRSASITDTHLGIEYPSKKAHPYATCLVILRKGYMDNIFWQKFVFIAFFSFWKIPLPSSTG